MAMGPQLTQTAPKMGIREGWVASVGNSGSRRRNCDCLYAAIPRLNPKFFEISQSDARNGFSGVILSRKSHSLHSLC